MSESRKSNPVQVRLGGFGGQGIVLAATLLGKAASLYDGKDAVFTQAYGPEARGGASRADVIIADEPVDYPYVTEPDVLAVLFQEAYVEFGQRLAPGGVLIIDEDLVQADDGKYTPLKLPATRLAEELGNRIVTNVVLLGFLVGQTGVVSRQAAEQAIRSTVKEKAVELNMRAFNAGFSRADPAGRR